MSRISFFFIAAAHPSVQTLRPQTRVLGSQNIRVSPVYSSLLQQKIAPGVLYISRYSVSAKQLRNNTGYIKVNGSLVSTLGCLGFVDLKIELDCLDGSSARGLDGEGVE